MRSAKPVRRLVIGVTLARIPLAITFLILSMRFGPVQAHIMIVLAVLVELSDASDGQIARRCEVASVSGGILDSGSDQIARAAEFIGLAYRGLVPFAVVLLFICRDAVIMSLRQLADSSGPQGQLKTRATGKVKGVAQGGCIIVLCFILVIRPSSVLTFSAAPVGIQVCVWLTTFATIVSLVDYIAAYCRLRRFTMG